VLRSATALSYYRTSSHFRDSTVVSMPHSHHSGHGADPIADILTLDDPFQ
jgi:hypothetical protein